MAQDTHVYGEVNNKTDMKDVFCKDPWQMSRKPI